MLLATAASQLAFETCALVAGKTLSDEFEQPVRTKTVSQFADNSTRYARLNLSLGLIISERLIKQLNSYD